MVLHAEYQYNMHVFAKNGRASSKNAKFLCLPVGIARYFRGGAKFFFQF
jgi:hypothetical protein